MVHSAKPHRTYEQECATRWCVHCSEDWTRNGFLAMLRCGVEESVAMHADGAEESRLELASLESRTAAAEADARDFFEPIMYQLVDGHCVTFAVGSTVPLNNSTPRAQFLSREAACLHLKEVSPDCIRRGTGDALNKKYTPGFLNMSCACSKARRADSDGRIWPGPRQQQTREQGSQAETVPCRRGHQAGVLHVQVELWRHKDGLGAEGDQRGDKPHRPLPVHPEAPC